MCVILIGSIKFFIFILKNYSFKITSQTCYFKYTFDFPFFHSILTSTKLAKAESLLCNLTILFLYELLWINYCSSLSFCFCFLPGHWNKISPVIYLKQKHLTLEISVLVQFSIFSRNCQKLSLNLLTKISARLPIGRIEATKINSLLWTSRVL